MSVNLIRFCTRACRQGVGGILSQITGPDLRCEPLKQLRIVGRNSKNTGMRRVVIFGIVHRTRCAPKIPNRRQKTWNVRDTEACLRFNIQRARSKSFHGASKLLIGRPDEVLAPSYGQVIMARADLESVRIRAKKIVVFVLAHSAIRHVAHHTSGIWEIVAFSRQTKPQDRTAKARPEHDRGAPLQMQPARRPLPRACGTGPASIVHLACTQL